MLELEQTWKICSLSKQGRHRAEDRTKDKVTHKVNAFTAEMLW